MWQSLLKLIIHHCMCCNACFIPLQRRGETNISAAWPLQNPVYDTKLSQWKKTIAITSERVSMHRSRSTMLISRIWSPSDKLNDRHIKSVIFLNRPVCKAPVRVKNSELEILQNGICCSYEKLEWCGYQVAKEFWRCFVTDRRTDMHTDIFRRRKRRYAWHRVDNKNV